MPDQRYQGPLLQGEQKHNLMTIGFLPYGDEKIVDDAGMMFLAIGNESSEEP